jgi:hypothetical protein
MCADDKIFKKEKELVIARLESLAPDLHFSSGDFVNLSRDGIIEEIKKDSEIGREFVEMEMQFLRALKNGNLMKELNKV